ncbi:hypothetical protein ACWX0P_29170 [Vibrio mediterranei]
MFYAVNYGIWGDIMLNTSMPLSVLFIALVGAGLITGFLRYGLASVKPDPMRSVIVVVCILMIAAAFESAMYITSDLFM